MIPHTPYFIKQNQKKPTVNRVRYSIPTFLVKTFEMLEVSRKFEKAMKAWLQIIFKNQEHKDVVCWSEDG